ncbi:efflux RND transporter periplasmic adaptor subunit [Novibacillus thermophilus]|uniref:Uncharacterized protein n=1 Tax=Novibacillus thermophilus TaxID=1471761 RepID=A0A1U9KB67_9BACL|nr:efflux RND transporter periplasmic adaptor subunit [Novibacillus thermophilus]AQS57233.1 hypothetical protein B0W44_17275 [Novibacillus thermophilus]
MKKIWIAIGVATVIVLLVGINVWRQVAAEGLTVKTTQLEQREIASSVMTPGTLKLKNEQTVYASPEKGEVDEILVEEGDQVKEGDALLRYANEQLELEKEQNALTIESNYLRLNHLKKQLDRLDEKEDEADEQIGGEQAVQSIEDERDQLEMERRMANIELKQAQLQKETIDKQLKDLTVKSEVDGTVLSVDEVAAHATNQTEPQPVIRIAALDELIVEGVISEYDTLKVEEGQAVVLSSDVVPDEEWKGKVTHIGYLPEQSNSMNGETEAVQYAVEVAVESEDIPLKPGFQMIMEIETEKRKVPTLPLSAVISESRAAVDGDSTEASSEEEHYVFVVKDGKAERRPVEVGIVSDDRIEIKDGLEPDEHVIVDPPDDLKDGAEVTVK